ncbi:secretory phospholipase A2 receptor-like [Triplophysa rosa]|uniref:secretory phospholipase A2 receptor-like n=1 Tax=Triplophysa rosa TaxID=992332 RepID=UPI002545D9B1|nr:secretory phospholipase A2 receptor-like [Triplophysa rosa]
MKTTLTVLLIIQLYGLASCATKQFYLINEMKTWDEASQHCKTYFERLSTFNDEIEIQHFLEDAVNQISDAWVGLRKINDGWMWSGFQPAKDVSWNVGEPQRDCAFLPVGNNKLSTQDCSVPLPFFCMKIYEIVEVQQSESWEGALEYCRHHHDDLASLSSNRRMKDALSKITGAQTQYVWIGLRFLAGGWFWISGDDLILNVWSSAGPPQCPAQNQRCAALDENTQTWTPRDCKEKLNLLCFGQPEGQNLLDSEQNLIQMIAEEDLSPGMESYNIKQ